VSPLPAPDRDEADVGDPSILRRVTLSSLIGTAAEYYDYVQRKAEPTAERAAAAADDDCL